MLPKGIEQQLKYVILAGVSRERCSHKIVAPLPCVYQACFQSTWEGVWYQRGGNADMNGEGERHYDRTALG